MRVLLGAEVIHQPSAGHDDIGGAERLVLGHRMGQAGTGGQADGQNASRCTR
jgi:hypothetical protein